mmetsp:Transcript_30827/g.67512  ORF Transcript_30827/g.67512 Transcript_30827/m.67512 type:complete len:219 (+) Transcript_30827:501-1157(+)
MRGGDTAMGTAARLGLFKDVAPVIPVRVSRDLIEMCGKAYEMTRVHLADVARRARSQLTLRACEKQRGAAYKAVRSSLRSRETELLAAVAAAVAAAVTVAVAVVVMAVFLAVAALGSTAAVSTTTTMTALHCSASSVSTAVASSHRIGWRSMQTSASTRRGASRERCSIRRRPGWKSSRRRRASRSPSSSRRAGRPPPPRRRRRTRSGSRRARRYVTR